MGSPENEVGRSSSEGPLHEVCINGFWMGKYEVTQAQWQQVMGKNPASFTEKKVGMNTQNHPVERVSWMDIQEFFRELNQKTGMEMFRLPSEAE